MRYKAVMSLAGLVAVATTQAAGFVIDDFQDSTLVGKNIGALPTTDAPGVIVTISGFNRVTSVTPAVETVLAGVNVGGGGAGFLQNPNASDEDVTFKYSGGSWVSPKDWEDDLLSLDYDADPAAVGYSTIAFILTDGTNTDTWTSTVLAAAGTVTASVDSGNFPTVTWTAITGVTIKINGVADGADVAIDNFTVPEPSTYAPVLCNDAIEPKGEKRERVSNSLSTRNRKR
jgi:hypothetical protein